MKGLYILKKIKNRRDSVPTDIKTYYKDKLIKTITMLVQGWGDIPIKQNTGFGNSTHMCRGTWFIMEETSQINTEKVNYLVDCDADIEKQREKLN